MQDVTASHLTKIDDALDYLNEFAPSLYTNVLNLGTPTVSSSIDTAAVGLTTEGNLEFMFGTKMLSDLNHEEVATVLVHESMHVMLNHVFAYNTFADQMLVNQAMDAVINDFLINNNFTMPTGKWEGYSGYAKLGTDCSNMTISQVIDLIEEIGENNNDDGDGDGDGDDQDQQPGGSGFDQHGWMEMTDQQMEDFQNSVDKKDQQAPDELDSNKEDPDDHDQDVSRGLEGGSEREILESGIAANWVELLREINPDIIPEPSYLKQSASSWNIPSRKVLGYYPDLLLPTYNASTDREGWGNEKPSIVMCLDTSGSVSANDVAMFLALARSIPRDRVEIKLYGYHSKAYKIDIDKPKIHSGGTAFASAFDLIMTDHCNNDVSKFPNAVIVITDMQDSFTSYPPSNSYGNKYDMNKVIHDNNLKDNFFVMHNYSDLKGYRGQYKSCAKKIAREENIRSMYEFIDRKTLGQLAASSSYSRG